MALVHISKFKQKILNNLNIFFMEDLLGFIPSQLEVFNQEEPKSTGNSNIYKPKPSLSKSEDGHYRATIKVIYNPHDIKKSILEVQSYAIQDSEGWLVLTSSLTNNDTNCPIFKAWKQCRYSKDPKLNELALSKDKGGKGIFDKRFGRYALVQVLEDQNAPDLEGKYMFMKLPKAIWEMINTKMNPSAESKKAAIPVMDFLFGRAIELDVAPGPDDKNNPERKTRDISYSASELTEDIYSCVNPDGTPILNDEEQATLDEYVSMMQKGVWKEKDVEKRAKNLAEINDSELAGELRKIYSRVLNQIKEQAPNLVEEMGYQPWTEHQIERVNAWIKIVLAGGDPSTMAAPAAVTEAAKVDEAVSKTETVETDDESDLPF